MRKIIMLVLSVLAILLSGFFTASTASAYDLPPDAYGYKFWSPEVCVDGSAINGSSYQVAYLAQQWNLRTTMMALDYEDDCAAAGYPASRRMVIGTYNNPNDPYCLYTVNMQYNTVNGMRRWTNGPGTYINIAHYGCAGTQAYRDHLVSSAIGYLLGLRNLNSTGYNSRVMNGTAYSFANVTSPDQNSANTLDMIYAHAYCQPFGTLC